MKTKLLFALITLLFASVSMGQEVKQQTPNDKFMEFLLNKAEKYSAAGEQLTQKAVDTLVTEAGPIAEEYIKWKIIDHTIEAAKCLVPFFIASVLGLVLMYKTHKGTWNWSGEESAASVFPFIACMLIFCFALIGMMSTFVGKGCGVNDAKLAVKAYVSPRIYIAEQIFNTLKK